MLELPPGVTLYFARHGQTQANVENRFSGQKDTPLTAKGREQARAVGEILGREVGPDPVLDFVCSPLARAQATMRIAREIMGLAPDAYRIDERLKEIDLGSWDQLDETQARALDPALYEKRLADKWNVRVPEGENYAEVAMRCRSWLADVKTDTFAVSHGAFTRILRGLFAGLDGQAMSGLDEPQGVVFRARGHEVARLDP